jgi:hypothetical protein
MLYTGVSPSFALNLLQNTSASYQLTRSTGRFAARLPGLSVWKELGLDPITSRYNSCVTGYFAMEKFFVSVTECCNSVGSPALPGSVAGLPIRKITPVPGIDIGTIIWVS